MEFLWGSLWILLTLGVPPNPGQTVSTKEQPKPIETSVCKILENPFSYNNKLVKLRGTVHVGLEYSTLSNEPSSDQIWFAFGDGSAPPGMVAIINGKGSPGERESNGAPTYPIPICLIRDSNYVRLIGFLAASAKGDSCIEEASPATPPDCRTYRVTATFSGRIDAVSKEIHAAHLKRSSRDPVDGKGFGHMGMFDAQIVVQSVENVVALDLSDPNQRNPERR